MKHDWSSFGADMKALIESRGTTGNRGCHVDKPLVDHEKTVTPEMPKRLPLENEGLPAIFVRGNQKVLQLQGLTQSATPATPVTPSFESNYAAVKLPSESMHSTHNPSGWREGYRKLSEAVAPDDFRPELWQSMIEDGAAFLAQWGQQAVALGWRDVDLFGVDPVKRSARIGSFGVAFLIQRGAVVAITETSAAIRRQSGATVTWRRADARQIAIWDLLR